MAQELPVPRFASGRSGIHRPGASRRLDRRSRCRCQSAVSRRDDALRSDLRQIGRLSKIIAPVAGGMDVAPLAAELAERVSEELDYTLEAASQQQAATGFRGQSEFVVPAVITATRRVMISEWVDGTPLSSVVEWREPERNAAALRYVRFLFAGPSIVGLLHADPHPGNFKIMSDGRLGVVDFGLVARLPQGLPPAMGRILRIAMKGDAERVVEGLRQEGFVASDIDAADLMEYLGPLWSRLPWRSLSSAGRGCESNSSGSAIPRRRAVWR